MIKRRIATIVTVAACLCCALFATQKTYDYDDWEYRIIDYISQVSDVTGPHDTTPVSGSALVASLQRIDKSGLPVNLRGLYESMLEELAGPVALYRSDTMFFDFALPISPELYLKVGDDSSRQDWYQGYDERSALATLSFEFGWSRYVYGKFTLPFKIRLSDDHFNEFFAQNAYMGGTEPYQRVTPFDSGISVGNSFFNFFLGRGQLNMGRGCTGNLFVADNFQFQDFAKISFYDDFFSYDFTYTHFDQELPLSETGGVNSIAQWMRMDGPHQSRVTHSYAFDILDKVTITLREGAVLQTKSALDLRMFNPFIFLHNWQGFEKESGYWANNFAAVDVTAALGGGFRLNLQLLIDQFQLSSEMEAGANMYPNAFGVLANLSRVEALENSFWENHIEVVYTSPYLYLNDLDENNENMDLILGYYLSYGSDISYSGYKYGPDSIVFAFGGNWLRYDGLLDLTYTLMYRLHGDRGIRYSASQNQDSHSIGNDPSHVYDLALTGTIEHTFLANVGVTCRIHDAFSVTTGLTYQVKLNYGNHDDVNWQNLQWMVGFTIDPTGFFK